MRLVTFDVTVRAPSLTRRTLLRATAHGLLASAVIGTLGPLAAWAQDFEPFWVQTHVRTPLWSTTEEGADSFGSAPAGSYFRVVQPQTGPRLYVFNPVTQNFCYIDAAAVGPVPSPSAEALAQRPPLWVGNHQPTMLWSGPSPQAVPLGQVGLWESFEVLTQNEARLRVRDPLTGEAAYLDAAAVGPVDPPSGPFAPADRWRGLVGTGIRVRAEPTTRSPIVGELSQQVPVVVSRWVTGEEVFPDQPGWAQLADGAYVYGALLRPAPIAVPPRLPSNAPATGKWIDVNLTHQVAVAYDGRTPVYRARYSSGRPTWETSTGVYRIFHRVEKETMDSTTLIGRDAARAEYRVEDIKWTQYFTNDGQAIHHNYWRDPALFGIPSSHGCLGMLEPDAKWLWDWASLGTPLVIHHETTP